MRSAANCGGGSRLASKKITLSQAISAEYMWWMHPSRADAGERGLRRRLDAGSLWLAAQSRPLLQQAERRGEVKIVPALFAGQLVTLVHGFQRRQLDAVLLGRVEHDVDVFMHQAQWEIRRVIAPQHERGLVIHHS